QRQNHLGVACRSPPKSLLSAVVIPVSVPTASEKASVLLLSKIQYMGVFVKVQVVTGRHIVPSGQHSELQRKGNRSWPGRWISYQIVPALYAITVELQG